MTGMETFIGSLSALAIASVAWAYNTIVRHNEQIAVLQSQHADILCGVIRVEKAIEKQTDTCRKVLTYSTRHMRMTDGESSESE